MLLSDVCVSRTSGLSREQRPRKIKIGTEVAYVTRESDTTFKIKGQGHQSALVRLGSLYWQTNMDIELVTDPDTCMMYIVTPLAGLGGGILRRPPAYSLLIRKPFSAI